MQLSQPTATIETGAVIGGRYRVGELLGRGGMAEVYGGMDLRLQRPVAVKLLRQEMAARPDIRARFQAEALAAAGLCHPHAVAVYDTGDHQGVPYLVMERLPGTTLADRIADGPVDPGWLRNAAAGVLGALDAAHRAGIVHRDVKPGNILLAADGSAKITDFGIAKSVHPGEESSGDHMDLTATGQLLGTPAYLAPERLEGQRATPRSDLWAFGVVMYEALTGRKPFSGRSPLEVANAVVTGEHVPLGEARPDLDPALVAVVERALTNNPAGRFATAAEMAAALDGPPPDATDVLTAPGLAAVPGEASATTAQSSVAPGAAAAAAAAPAAAGPRPAPPRPRRGVAWLVVGALIVLAALLLGWADTPTIPTSARTAPSATTPEQGLAARMRAFADRLQTDRDGARAGDLATGMRRVAADLEAEARTAAGQATGLIVSTGTWYRAGQLREAVTVEAVELLRQVPGVGAQIPSPAPTEPRATNPPATDPPATTPTTVAATTTDPPRRAATTAAEAGAGEKGKGKGKDKDSDDD